MATKKATKEGAGKPAPDPLTSRKKVDPNATVQAIRDAGGFADRDAETRDGVDPADFDRLRKLLQEANSVTQGVSEAKAGELLRELANCIRDGRPLPDELRGLLVMALWRVADAGGASNFLMRLQKGKGRPRKHSSPGRLMLEMIFERELRAEGVRDEELYERVALGIDPELTEAAVSKEAERLRKASNRRRTKSRI